MGSFLKAVGIGLATYYGYRAIDAFIVKPLVTKLPQVPYASGLLMKL